MNRFFCGVDLGGTKLSAGLVDNDGKVVDKILVRDHTKKPENMVVEEIVLMVKKLINRNDLYEQDLPGLGVGFPGHIRFDDGVTITSSNLKGFKNFPLRDELQKHFKIPVIVDNDANAQAYGEYMFGAGKGYNTMIFMTISTGIGAGIVIKGKLFRGTTGTAGEIGHAIVDVDSKRKCTCGNYGCLMTCACGLALPELYRERIESGKYPGIVLGDNFDYENVNGYFIKSGLEENDPVCRNVMHECADYAGVAVYNLFQTFNPPIIVLGGGLVNWGKEYLSRIDKKFNELVKDMLYDPIVITATQLGHDAGLIGASSLILE